MLPQEARVSGPSLSDGRVRTDEVIFAENEGRKVFPAGALHSADLARTQEQQELGMRSHAPCEHARARRFRECGRGEAERKEIALGEVVN